LKEEFYPESYKILPRVPHMHIQGNKFET